MLWHMPTERQVRLFRNGRNQAVRIPREFEMAGDLAIMWKEGDSLVIAPVRKRSLAVLLASWEPMDDDIGEIEDRPPEPVEL